MLLIETHITITQLDLGRDPVGDVTVKERLSLDYMFY